MCAFKYNSTNISGNHKQGVFNNVKDVAIVLVSGGMDSCVTVGIANAQYQLAMLHVNYGQRTETRELKAFHDIAAYYKVPNDRTLISHVDYLSKIGGSSLTDQRMDVHVSSLGRLPLLDEQGSE